MSYHVFSFNSLQTVSLTELNINLVGSKVHATECILLITGSISCLRYRACYLESVPGAVHVLWNRRSLVNFQPSHSHLFEWYYVANKCLKMISFPTVGVLVPWQPHWFDFGSMSQNWRLFFLPAAITTKSLGISPKRLLFLTDQISGGRAHQHMPSNTVPTFTACLHLTPVLVRLFWGLKSWCHRLSCNHAFVTPSHRFGSLKSRMPGWGMLRRAL